MNHGNETSPDPSDDDPNARAQIALLLARLDIPLRHDEACRLEAERLIAQPGLDDPQLVDWRELPFVTIDNADSRDLDQALLIERDGGFRLRYALADAAWYVRPGMALFRAALERGSSFYAPGLMAPMLPAELSEGLISLNPEVDRRALVFDIHLDEDGVTESCQVIAACIRSQAKLDYAGVQAWLDRGAPEGTFQTGIAASLRELPVLGERLISLGRQRGVVPFDRRETEITIEGEPPHFVAHRRKRHDTERYNEQLSLICNMQGAALLSRLDDQSAALQAVYRIHEGPRIERQRDLRRTLDRLIEFEELDEVWRWRWQDGEDLASYLERLPDDAASTRRVAAIQRQILLTQRASRFVSRPGRHHALKAASYARFSSPMREVVGIFTHKEIREALGLDALLPRSEDQDAELRERVIEAANLARQRQRALDKAVELRVLQHLLLAELALDEPPMHTGTVVGLRTDRIYISTDDLAFDLKVYIDDLERLYGTAYRVDELQARPERDSEAAEQSAPRLTLGHGVTLRVAGHDTDTGRFVFHIQEIDRHEQADSAPAG